MKQKLRKEKNHYKQLCLINKRLLISYEIMHGAQTQQNLGFSSEMSEQFQVQKILRSRVNRSRGGLDYFIKWKDYPQNESTWEHESNLTNCHNLIRMFKMAHPQSAKPKIAPRPIKDSPETSAKMKQNKAQIARRNSQAKSSEEETQDQQLEVEEDENLKVLAMGKDERQDIYYKVVENGLTKKMNRTALLKRSIKAMIAFYHNQFETGPAK